jgi:hypothetical protein
VRFNEKRNLFCGAGVFFRGHAVNRPRDNVYKQGNVYKAVL